MSLPVIDLSPLLQEPRDGGAVQNVAATVDQACRETGFLYVRVPDLDIGQLLALTRIFDLPQEAKDALDASQSPLFRGRVALDDHGLLGLPKRGAWQRQWRQRRSTPQWHCPPTPKLRCPCLGSTSPCRSLWSRHAVITACSMASTAAPPRMGSAMPRWVLEGSVGAAASTASHSPLAPDQAGDQIIATPRTPACRSRSPSAWSESPATPGPPHPCTAPTSGPTHRCCQVLRRRRTSHRL